MQFAKDSFFMALCNRLASLNPQRVITVNGIDRTAVIVTENEVTSAAAMVPEAFYLEWKAPRVVERQNGASPLLGIDCVISYCSAGTTDSGVDRGRSLATLDGELLYICHPPHTRKRDFSRTPSVDLTSNIFWSTPEWVEGDSRRDQASADRLLKRQAQLTVFFFPEADPL
jgi:hypothetical protein